MEVGLVLQVVDFLDEFVLDLVRNVKLLEALTNLQLEIVIGLLNLSDVHFLELNFSVKSIENLPLSSARTNSEERPANLHSAGSQL